MRSVPVITIAALMWAAAAPHADGAKPSKGVMPPKDAVVLFDGKSLDAWTRDNGQPCAWKLKDGAMEITQGGGSAVSKHEFSAGRIHLEFNLPKDGKGHGNSGIYIHRLYEVQIIDSFNKNPYKPGQQCGALYQAYPPDKQVCKAPGEWQTYDIEFSGPKLNDAGKVVKPATFTVWLNGVRIHHNRQLTKGTGAGAKRKMVSKGSLLLQNHGAAVQFRNIWIQPLAGKTK